MTCEAGKDKLLIMLGRKKGGQRILPLGDEVWSAIGHLKTCPICALDVLLLAGEDSAVAEKVRSELQEQAEAAKEALARRQALLATAVSLPPS